MQYYIVKIVNIKESTLMQTLDFYPWSHPPYTQVFFFIFYFLFFIFYFLFFIFYFLYETNTFIF